MTSRVGERSRSSRVAREARRRPARPDARAPRPSLPPTCTPFRGSPRGGPRHHPGRAAARVPFPRDGDSIAWTRSASSSVAPPPPDDVDDEHRVIEIDLRGPPSTAVDVSDEVGQRFFGAPADYAGVAIRSTLNWPLPMDQVAKLNPKLALAMGASRAQVAGANRDRHTRLDPILPGEHRREGDGGLRLEDIDTSTMDDDEIEIIRMLRDDEARERRRRATALDRARERRDAERERGRASRRRRRRRSSQRAVRPEEEWRGESAREKAEYEAELARLEAERRRVRLAEEWRAAKEEGASGACCPRRGPSPGRPLACTTRSSDNCWTSPTVGRWPTHVRKPLAVRGGTAEQGGPRARVRHRRAALGGDKKTMTEMLLTHFEKGAEAHFARAFVRNIANLDAQVRRVKARARAAAEEGEKEGAARGEGGEGGGARRGGENVSTRRRRRGSAREPRGRAGRSINSARRRCEGRTPRRSARGTSPSPRGDGTIRRRVTRRRMTATTTSPTRPTTSPIRPWTRICPRTSPRATRSLWRASA